MQTANLLILACDRVILAAAIEGNQTLAQNLHIKVEPGWTEFGTAALQYSLDKLSVESEEAGWWTYFPIHKEDNRLIGSGGYKGKPGPEGMVEIGYEICPEYRNKGLATEMAKSLVESAFACSQVKIVSAHTLGEPNASTKVLLKCGFKKSAEINDPDNGLLWRWELTKADHVSIK